MIESAGYISPEGEARLAKYGSTLSHDNVRLLIERIEDYPEIIAAVRALVPEPATSNPGSKLEQVGAAGGGLSEEERVALGTAYYDAPTETDAIAAVERIVREREAAALAAIRDAFWECFDPDFGGVDWRDDAAIQTFARKVAPYVNRRGDR